jgi:hypothetical protein
MIPVQFLIDESQMLAPMFDLHYTDLRLIAKVKKAQELIDSNVLLYLLGLYEVLEGQVEREQPV